MKKMTVFFETIREPEYMVIDKIRDGNEWVLTHGIPTRKFDGTACIILKDGIYKRYDVKNGKTAPDGAIPCGEKDEITGHHPHWVKCDINNPADKYFFEAIYTTQDFYEVNKTYELCGEKINGNPEKIVGHKLIQHGSEVLNDCTDFSFEGLKKYLLEHDIEGIVFHEKDGDRMCKIRKKDFLLKR